MREASPATSITLTSSIAEAFEGEVQREALDRTRRAAQRTSRQSILRLSHALERLTRLGGAGLQRALLDPKSDSFEFGLRKRVAVRGRGHDVPAVLLGDTVF